MRQRSKALSHTYSYIYTCTLHLSSLTYGKASPPPWELKRKSLSLVLLRKYPAQIRTKKRDDRLGICEGKKDRTIDLNKNRPRKRPCIRFPDAGFCETGKKNRPEKKKKTLLEFFFTPLTIFHSLDIILVSLLLFHSPKKKKSSNPKWQKRILLGGGGGGERVLLPNFSLLFFKKKIRNNPRRSFKYPSSLFHPFQTPPPLLFASETRKEGGGDRAGFASCGAKPAACVMQLKGLATASSTHQRFLQIM